MTIHHYYHLKPQLYAEALVANNESAHYMQMYGVQIYHYYHKNQHEHRVIAEAAENQSVLLVQLSRVEIYDHSNINRL